MTDLRVDSSVEILKSLLRHFPTRIDDFIRGLVWIAELPIRLNTTLLRDGD